MAKDVGDLMLEAEDANTGDEIKSVFDIPADPPAAPKDEPKGGDDPDPPADPPESDEITPQDAQGLRDRLSTAPGTQPAQPPQAPSQSPLASFSDEEVKALAATGNDKFVAELSRRSGQSPPLDQEAIIAEAARRAQATIDGRLSQDSWDMKALKDFPELAQPGSQMEIVTAQFTADMLNKGYTGSDIHYRAATLARTQLGRDMDEESARNRRIDRGSSIKSPSPDRQRGKDPAGFRLTPTMKAMAERDGIDLSDPKIEAHLTNKLRRANARLKAEGLLD